MTIITLEHYLMGREKKFRAEFNEGIAVRATGLLVRVNKLLSLYGKPLENDPDTGTPVTSGWRPPSYNAKVPNAAVRSKHMLGGAIDLFDPEGDLDDWCMDNHDRLAGCLLWLEHPSATKGWCHLQDVPPGSKKRVFYP